MAFQFELDKKSKDLVFSDNDKTQLFEKISNTIDQDDIGFFRIENLKCHIKPCEDLFQKFSHKKTFVQVGIGGSALGPQMLLRALGNQERDFYFIDNVDPEDIHVTLSKIDCENTLFYVVSKSGGTIETIAGLAIVTNFLTKKGIPAQRWNEFIIFCTDKEKGELNPIAQKHNISCLIVPDDVGGRFSVLTPVGLLPALFSGININELLDGAQEIANEFLHSRSESNLITLALTLKHWKNQSINQTVMMPYSSRLKEFSAWFTQLWAESLGKEIDRHSKKVEIGLTPIPAFGATDQHSQVQLFMEGPRDKFIFFIRINQFEHDFSLDNTFDSKTASLIRPYNLSQLIEAELSGTIKALEQKERPFCCLSLSHNNAMNIGGLILYFELLTCAMGEVFEINAFNQPGVENGKIYAKEILRK